MFINDQVPWDAQVADFKTAVETLSNVEAVEVTKDEWTDTAGFDYFQWTVGISRRIVQTTNASLRNL